MIKNVRTKLLILAAHSYAMADEVKQFQYSTESEKITINSAKKLNPRIKYSTFQAMDNKSVWELQLPNYTVLSPDIYNSLPIVVGGSNKNQVGFSLGDTVYIKNYDVNSSSQLVFIRKFRDLIDPATKENLGIEYSVNASGLVNDVTSNLASVELFGANNLVSVDDRAMTSNNLSFIKIVAYYSDIFISGKIIASYDSISSTAMMSSVVINKGIRDGVKAGALFDIVDNSLLKDHTSTKSNPQYLILPEQTIGEILIYSAYEKVSFGLIIKSNREIPLYAEVKSKKDE
ncbi:MAG: hypothetical protein PHC75_08725 [Burkholderiales bacterium]|nr:hypothetical protein [Burkholderiales bacterium]